MYVIESAGTLEGTKAMNEETGKPIGRVVSVGAEAKGDRLHKFRIVIDPAPEEAEAAHQDPKPARRGK
jgi:hypothetical protein